MPRVSSYADGTPTRGDYLYLIDGSNSRKLAIEDAVTTTAILVAGSDAPTRINTIADYVCDGTDDEVEINAAIADANGDLPVMLVGSFSIDTNAVDLDVDSTELIGGLGSTITIGTGFDGDADAAIKIFGGKDDVGALTANASQGDTSVTVASQAVVPFDGGWLSIHDNTDFSNRAQYENGQLVRCAGTSGSTINLYGRCETAYTTANSGEVDLIYPRSDCRIAGLSFVVDATTTNEPVVIASDYALNLKIERCKINGSDDARRGIDIRRSINTKIEDIYVERVQHGQRGGGAAIGYGVCIRGSLSTFISNVHGFRNRHTIEVGAGESDYPIDRHTVVRDCYAHYDYSSGFSTHGGAERTEFINCEADTCGGGFFGRSPNLTFRSCTVRGLHNENDITASDESVDHAFRFEEDTVTGPGAMRDISIIDCAHLGESVSGFNNRTIHVAADIIGGEFLIQNLNSEAASDQPITFEGGVNAEAVVKIIGGNIDMNNVGGVGDMCIDFDGSIDGSVWIEGVFVKDLRNNMVELSGGGAGDIWVTKNTCLSVSGTGTAAQDDSLVTLSAGTYTGSLAVFENDCHVWADSGTDFVDSSGATVTGLDETTFRNRHSTGYDAAYP